LSSLILVFTWGSIGPSYASLFISA
jgi:hypothetical protein